MVNADEIRQYALGNQDVTKYKKMLEVPKASKDWINIDWRPPKKLLLVRLRLLQMIKNRRMIKRLKKRTLW